MGVLQVRGWAKIGPRIKGRGWVCGVMGEGECDESSGDYVLGMLQVRGWA